MNLPKLSITRPVFITCVFTLIMAIGALSMSRIGVDLFPDVSFPIVSVTTAYPGAGPQEIETLVSKPLENDLSTLSGVKSIRSINSEGTSTVIAEFTLDTDIRYAEQKVRDRVSTVTNILPGDVQQPIIRSIDPADQPVLVVAMTAKLEPGELFDLAEQEIRTQIEQVNQVGTVYVLGGREREIQVLLDRNKLNARQISASQVAGRIGDAGKNIPAGKAKTPTKESVVRTLGEFESLSDIRRTVVSFFGDETPTTVGDIATVVDSLKDETTRTYVNGQQALTLMVYRQSGANTIQVVNDVKKRLVRMNEQLSKRYEGFDLSVVRDGGKPIQANVDDVTEAIIIGILLTIVVVYFALGSARSTVITGIALPNSLLGAFILMAAFGFTINIMTLLAMSLAVGLLIDDAIVVRENIFRHMELGATPREAAERGTREVTLAVVATTLTVIAVFGPVAFLEGMVGQFFKEFGLTICFAMAISLLDALTMAPMLSAYFAGDFHAKPKNAVSRFMRRMVEGFGRFQDRLEVGYIKSLKFSLNHKITVLIIGLVIFVASLFVASRLPATFVPPQDVGEFSLVMDLPAGTPLERMNELASEVDQKIRDISGVRQTVLTVGGTNGEPNEANIFIKLTPAKERDRNTSQYKDLVREKMKSFAQANPKVQDAGMIGGASEQPFNVNIIGNDFAKLEKVALELRDRLVKNNDLQDVDVSFRPGKPEIQVDFDKRKGERLGISSTLVGQELRTQIEGGIPAVLREKGYEYDIRVRLEESQRNLKENYSSILVPNVNQRLVRLADVAKINESEGPSTIYRQDRGRYIKLSAGLNPDGRGMAQAIGDVTKLLNSGEIEIPEGVRYQFVGSAESFQELATNMLIAAVLSVLFIYLVLASLYESFVTPFTIMLVLPLAACGAFYALWIAGSTLDIFSMIGCILLLGIATKNSILLVDYIQHAKGEGKSEYDAIIEAGKTRLRPILMTSFALIAGMLPIAIGLNEASKQRTSMGVAVIGGLLTSTLLTLFVIPAAYSYIERMRQWGLRLFHGKSAPAKQVAG